MTKKWYVVYYLERLRDGIEEGAKIVSSVEEGLKLIDKWANTSSMGSAHNHEFRLFELGKEIPLSEGTAEKTEVVKTVRKFQVNMSKRSH